MIEDVDGMGDSGVTFWVKGVYEDKDEDGTWDVCQNTNVTITESPDVNNSWEWAEILDGNFYNEVQANQGCDSNDKNTNNDREGKGLAKIGRACWGCYAGNVSFESNQSVWVTYDEKVGEELGEDIGIMILGFLGGFGSICCGIVLLIIGGILAFTMKDNKQQVMYSPPIENQMMVSNQDLKSSGPASGTYTNPDHLSAPATTHMSAPSFDEPPKGGL